MGKKLFEISAEPFGPNQKMLDRAADKMLKGPVAKRLKGCQHTLLSITAIDDGPIHEDREAPLPPDRVRAVVYDYTNEVALICEGPLDDAAYCTIQERRYHPIPSPKEFEAAVAKLRKSPEYGSALKAGTLVPYRPMPPLVVLEDGDGDAPRTVAVGLRPSTRHKSRARQTGFGNEIVGVRMRSGDIQQFSQGAPCRSRAEVRGCGAPTGAGQQTISSAAGQAWITIKKDNVVLWRFLAVRPAASSGTNGSGIELRYVSYRGKRVLYRAHVPILNVKYDNDICGPYRDWQNEEGMIRASGTELAPGILRCNSPARTIFDTGSDTGTYLGVGVYEENEETVLVSEMEAGWYRYLSQWRFALNGTIKPRFGFAAVENSCVCTRHHHHAYWRFDFDIKNAGSNQVFEHNNRPLPDSPWRPLNFEVRRDRNPARRRHWRIQNTVTKEAYLIVPGANDGVARLAPDWPFGRGDVWIMRTKRNLEYDDGVVATGPPYEADLDRFITGESIQNQDVVVWYCGHFIHDLTHDEPATHGHIVGPNLVPENW